MGINVTWYCYLVLLSMGNNVTWYCYLVLLSMGNNVTWYCYLVLLSVGNWCYLVLLPGVTKYVELMLLGIAT